MTEVQDRNDLLNCGKQGPFKLHIGDIVSSLEDVDGMAVYISKANQLKFDQGKPPIVGEIELRKFRNLPNVMRIESNRKGFYGWVDYIYLDEDIKDPKINVERKKTEEIDISTLSEEIQSILNDNTTSKSDKVRRLINHGIVNKSQLSKLSGSHYSVVHSICTKLGV